MPAYRLNPGELFDNKYQIESKLGEGGMAVVYRVSEGGEVATEHALKLIRLPSFPTEDALATAKKRFRHEAANLARLRHPHIVGVHRYDVASDGTPYLLMELLDGEDLGIVLKRTGTLPWKTALSVITQIASALEVLHAAGIVHRDLSPGNIFLLRQGKRLPEEAVFVKLLDFGIARGGDLNLAPVTDPNIRIGNPPYMPPECILRKKKRPPSGGPGQLAQSHDEAWEFDGRTDEFGLASILYEMLAGFKAFLPHGGDPTGAFARVLNEDPLKEPLPPSFSPALRAVLGRALSKDPEDRYPTVAEFVAALHAVDLSRDAPTIANLRRVEPVALSTPVRWLTPPSPRTLAFLGTLMLASIVGIFVYRQDLVALRAGLSHSSHLPPPSIGVIHADSPPAPTPPPTKLDDVPVTIVTAVPKPNAVTPPRPKPPRDSKPRFRFFPESETQKQQAEGALEIYKTVMRKCLVRQRGWREIHIIHMVDTFYVTGLADAEGNQDFKGCVTRNMPPNKVLPRKTVIARSDGE